MKKNPALIVAIPVTKKPIPTQAQTIGKRLNAAREKFGITVSAMAIALKLSPSYMAHVTAGRRGLTPEKAIEAARLMKCADLGVFLRPDQAKMVRAVAAALK